MTFYTPFFGPGLWAEIMSKNKQIFLFLSYSLIWNWNDKYVLIQRFFPRKPNPIPNQNEQSVYPFLDRKSAKTISFGVAHTYVAYSVFKGIFPGRESKYLKNSVRGPEFPLNVSFVRDMHFEKERIDLKGWYWTKQYKGKYKFGRLSSVNEKEMIFILANMVAD